MPRFMSEQNENKQRIFTFWTKNGLETKELISDQHVR